MKKFILIKSDNGYLQLGVKEESAYLFHDGTMEVTGILNGEAGSAIEVLSLQELEYRINTANDERKGGF